MRVRGNRRGFTLIEVTVLMTAVAVMLGLCVVVLQLALRLETDARGRFDRANALSRLAERFRADVHGARGVEIAPEKPEVLRVDSASGRSIEYRIQEAGEVSRVESEGDKIVHREEFRAPQIAETRLEIREIDGHRFAVLSVETLTRPDRIDPARRLEVLAMIGKTAGGGVKP